jgi:enamine deaminase RidA (YjgF/YER057c/UK114 family)
MSIERLHPGKRLSESVIHDGRIYLAGQVPLETAGRGVREQTEEVLANIDKLLAEAGSDKTKILSATIYLVDMRTFDEMNAAWDAWVAPGAASARACVEARLARLGWGVEISIVAAR